MAINDITCLPESVALFLKQLAARSNVEALILFGSRALGDHNERSDVDVAVVGPRISRPEWAQICDAASSARSLYWISLVHLDQSPAVLRDRVTSTGVTVYAKEA